MNGTADRMDEMKDDARLDGMKDEALLVAGQAVSLRSLVADRLRLAIITGRFRPGQQLRERELCELTGVSRPSLREALRQLEAEGLIATAPHRGPVVAALNVEEVGQLYALRQVLESFAAREFARLRRPADIAALKAAVKRLDEVEKAGTPLEMLEIGTAFYGAIATGSGNPYLAQTLGALHNRIALIRFISLHRRARIAQSFAALRALSEAIIAGDETLADRLCTELLEAVGATARAVVEAGYRLPGSADDAGLAA
ncbi:GntR family transcriptional regulator [Roseomonas hellenica]|uniref:GntR family transcriptional regulator n=1 Tax=Plastoroseomonas hellenica TaxID=2687306 RepID=A0ABS5F399_9PROT|nr:GntR family transcriptional regulator [Plastoroseomonas hellenica]MBR0667003.1 GntR family transcriptional regulator [Plastoroseomonas hellenica]